ncbi:MAG: translocation/assembly module TamB domain-containing protein [Pseudobdellovibrionaceae bacterium]
MIKKWLSYRWIKYLGEAFLFVIGLVALIQLAIAFAAVWINTQSGQAFVKSQLETALKDTPYKVTIGGYYYAPLNGLGLRDVTIADSEGAFLTLNKGALKVNLLPLAARHALFTIKGDHLTFSRLPTTPEKGDTPEDTSGPFTLPDLYFTKFGIDVLAFNTLELGEKLAGMKLELSPKLGASVTLKGNTLVLDAQGRIRQVDDALLPDWLPREIALKGDYTTDTQSGQIETLNFESPLYTVEGQGALAAEGQLSAKLHGALKENQTYEAYQVSPPEIDLEIAGTPQNAKGELNVTSSYQGEPVKLHSPLSYAEQILSLSKITLSAPDMSGEGAMELNTTTSLATGQFNLIAQSLEPLAALAGQSVSGSGELNLSFMDSGTGKQGANITALLTNIQKGDISVQSLKAQASLPDVAAIWPTALDVRGENIALSSDMRVNTLNVTLSEKAQGDDLYDLKISSHASLPQAVSLNGGADVAGLRNAQPALSAINLNIGSGKAPLKLTGAADLEKIDVTLSANQTPLSALPIPATLPGALSAARLSGDTRLHGALSAPQISSDMSLDLRRTGGTKTSMRVTANSIYTDGQLSSKISGTGTGVRNLSGDLTFPMQLSLSPFAFSLPPETPLKGQIDFGLDGGILAEAFLPPDHDFSGNLSGTVNLAGTISTPVTNGQVSLKEGTYIYIPYEVELHDLSLVANMNDKLITISSISATDGDKGTIKGSGSYDIANSDAARIDLNVDDYHLFKSQQVDGMVDAKVHLTPEGGGSLLAGDITLGEFNILIPERFGSSIPELNIVQKNQAQGDNALSKIALDMNINAPQEIFVRGWGLDAEFGGKLDLGGTLAKPLVNGSLAALRGRYEEFGKRFNLDNAKLRFQGEVPPSPYLDIKAVTKAEDIDAAIELSGPVNDPSISFSSVPALPEDEVLSRILFGSDMSTITPFQAIQLTQTLRRFSGQGGGGGFDAIGQLRSLTGLDDVRVDSDSDGETSVGVGKYLTDKVYLEFEKGAGEASGGATVQYELTPDINVESKIGQDAQGGAGINWNWDY